MAETIGEIASTSSSDPTLAVMSMYQGAQSLSSTAKSLSKYMTTTSNISIRNELSCIIFRLSWDFNQSVNITGYSLWASNRNSKTPTPIPASSPANLVDDAFWVFSGDNEVDIWCGADNALTLATKPAKPCVRWFFETWGTSFPLHIDFGGVKSNLAVISTSSANTYGKATSGSKSSQSQSYSGLFKMYDESTSSEANSLSNSLSEEEKSTYQDTKEETVLGGNVSSGRDRGGWWGGEG